MAETVDRSKLSQRENEILDLAIEGLTDHQIAYRLEISTSTVNSYWVRIRGKLGQLSRTELVSIILRQEAQERISQLQAESERLASLAERKEIDEANVVQAEIDRAILDAFPEPLLATDHHGVILYANAPLEEMFGFAPGELVGQSVEILIPPRDREAHRRQIAEYVAEPRQLQMGIGRVVYGQRKDGRLIRVILALNGRHTSRGTVTTCVVRSFNLELDNARRRASVTADWIRSERR